MSIEQNLTVEIIEDLKDANIQALYGNVKGLVIALLNFFRKEEHDAEMEKKVNFIHAHITAWYDEQLVINQIKNNTFLTNDRLE